MTREVSIHITNINMPKLLSVNNLAWCMMNETDVLPLQEVLIDCSISFGMFGVTDLRMQAT